MGDAMIGFYIKSLNAMPWWEGVLSVLFIAGMGVGFLILIGALKIRR